MKKHYYVHWMDQPEPGEYPANLVTRGSPQKVEADTPEEAWKKFHATHPTLYDMEGDYYIVIRKGRIARDDETDLIAEAGVDKGGHEYFTLI